MVDLMANLLMPIIEWNTPVWGYVISVFTGFLGNCALAIFVVALLIKVVLIPFDYFQRKNTNKNMEIQKVMQPELDKIKEKYKNYPEMAQRKMQEKQMEMYKKFNHSIIGSCLIMLVNIAITFVVSITFYTCLSGEISVAETTNMYTKLETEYTQVYNATVGTEEEKVAQAESAVVQMYQNGEATQSFLWIKNIWRPDTATSPIPTYSEFVKVSKYSNVEEDENYLSEDNYNKVMKPIMDSETGWNGYYILAVLVGVIMFLSMKFTMPNTPKKQPTQNQASDDPQVVAQEMSGKMMGGMRFILPVILVLFTLFANAGFSIYIIAFSLFSLITTPIFNKIINRKGLNATGGGSADNSIEVDYKIQKNTIIK